MAYRYSNFPDTIDTLKKIPEVTELQEEDKQKVLRYDELIKKTVLTDDEITELNNLFLELKDKKIISDDWNKVVDAIIATETYVKNDVLVDISDMVNQKESELDVKINNIDDKGEYNSDTIYYKNNIVKFNDGGGYRKFMAKDNPPVGTLPTDINYWETWDIKGERGERGYSGVGVVPKGVWDDTTTYNIDNGVFYNGQLFASKIDSNIGNEPLIGQDTDSWLQVLNITVVNTKLKGQRTLATASNVINFIVGEINVFNPNTDDLEVIVNSTCLEKNVDYKINADNQSITKISGEWEVGTVFYFRVTRNQINNLIFSDGQSIAEGTITKNKLSTDVQDTLDNVSTINDNLNDFKTENNNFKESATSQLADMANKTDDTKGAALIGMKPIDGLTGDNVRTIIQNLFQFASDGKTGIANAVTAKGVSASPLDTFSALATKIGQINTGKKSASGQCATNPDETQFEVRGLDFHPSIVIFTGYCSTSYQGNQIDVRALNITSPVLNFTFIEYVPTPYSNWGESNIIIFKDGFRVDNSGNISKEIKWMAIE